MFSTASQAFIRKAPWAVERLEIKGKKRFQQAKRWVQAVFWTDTSQQAPYEQRMDHVLICLFRMHCRFYGLNFILSAGRVRLMMQGGEDDDGSPSQNAIKYIRFVFVDEVPMFEQKPDLVQQV